MRSDLTKSDLCWVLIKFAGVCLIYTALASLWGAFVGWWSVSELFDSVPTRRGGPVLAPFKTMVFGSALPFILGVYLLTSGRAIHRCFMSVPVGSGNLYTESDPFGTGLAGAELEAFHSWISGHPEVRSQAIVDQLAHFRDAQRAGEAS